jgi:hypothetical protein
MQGGTRFHATSQPPDTLQTEPVRFFNMTKFPCRTFTSAFAQHENLNSYIQCISNTRSAIQLNAHKGAIGTHVPKLTKCMRMQAAAS